MLIINRYAGQRIFLGTAEHPDRFATVEVEQLPENRFGFLVKTEMKCWREEAGEKAPESDDGDGCYYIDRPAGVGFRIGHEILIMPLGIMGNETRVGISAPRDIEILREGARVKTRKQ